VTFWQLLRAALAGAVIGWVAVIIASTVMGVVVMFLAWPLYGMVLVVFGVAVALLVAAVARLMRRASARGVMIASAILTFASFSAAVLRIVAANAGGGRW